MYCKKCKSDKYVKNGKTRGVQKYLCKKCGCNFIEGDRRTNAKIRARKSLCVMLYATGRMSINKIAKIFGMCWSLVYRWINEAAENLEDYKIDKNITEVELDEMWHFLYKKTKDLGN